MKKTKNTDTVGGATGGGARLPEVHSLACPIDVLYLPAECTEQGNSGLQQSEQS